MKTVSTKPITIGWIPYWNLHPLRIELDKKFGRSLQFVDGHPSQINKRMAAGELSAAPCSSICLLKNSSLELLAPVGVVAQGAVKSVYLGSSPELRDLGIVIRDRIAMLKEIVDFGFESYGRQTRRVANFIWKSAESADLPDLGMAPRLKFTPNSDSSVALAKIVYRLLFCKNAFETNTTNQTEYGNVESGTMELLIGDEALVRRHEFSKVIDLSQLWHSMTGLPFVFAVWQKSHKNSIGSLANKIIETSEIAQSKMHIDPSVYLPDPMPLTQLGHDLDLSKYWRGISYRIGPREMEGLLLFLCLARPLMRVDIDDSMVVKMMRWQELCSKQDQHISPIVLPQY